MITSPRHPIVGAVRRLAASGGGRAGFCVAEGPHLVTEAARAGCALAAVLYTPAFAARTGGRDCLVGVGAAAGVPADAELPLTDRLTCVGPRAFAAISELESPQGVLAVVALSARPAEGYPPAAPPPIGLALDGVQDPGNVGTLARSLCAFAGARAPLWLGAGTADPFGGKALRASAGAVFRLAVRFEADLASAVAASGASGRRWWGLEARGGAALEDVVFAPACGFIVGNEGRGLSPAVRQVCQPLTIATVGPVESLAAPQAGTLALYVAGRSWATSSPGRAAAEPPGPS